MPYLNQVAVDMAYLLKKAFFQISFKPSNIEISKPVFCNNTWHFRGKPFKNYSFSFFMIANNKAFEI